jgi:DNA-directed RNA polymerase specialized sigma24 family protein
MQTLSDKALEHLTDKQQQVWHLVMRDFRTQAEAAKIIGITRDALKDRLAKAKRRYTKFIEAHI